MYIMIWICHDDVINMYDNKRHGIVIMIWSGHDIITVHEDDIINKNVKFENGSKIMLP